MKGWLVANKDLLPSSGRALDVACGRGAAALPLARSGLAVHAIDRNPEAIAQLQQLAREAGVVIDTEVADLETDPPPHLGSGEYDLVVVFRYLHRPLMSAIKEAVKPGGRIFYETFTARQAERGHPRNPAFLLRDGELTELLAPYTVLRSREGEFDGHFIASVIAERPK